MATLDSTVAPAKPTESAKTFAQALSGPSDFQLSKLHPKVVMGKTVRIKITQSKYEFGLIDCSSNIDGRLTLRKGDTPLSTMALKTKLRNLWPNILNWDLTSLGKGFFEFHFNSVEDMRRV